MKTIDWIIEEFKKQNISFIDIQNGFNAYKILAIAKEEQKKELEKLKDFETWKEWKDL